MKKIVAVLLSSFILACGGDKKDAVVVAESWLKENVLSAFSNLKIESISKQECKFDQTEVFNKQGTADNQRVALSPAEVELYMSGDRSNLAVNTKYTLNGLVSSTVDAYQRLLKDRTDYIEVKASLSFDLEGPDRGSFSYIIIMPVESMEVLNELPFAAN